MMGEAPPSKVQLIPPLGVITRQSTDILAITDWYVAQALHIIRRRACSGIDVHSLLEELPLSRRSLEQRFRRYLGRSPGAEIQIELELADGLPPVEADPLQFDLALTNLGLNARDAMPNGGTLRIETGLEVPAGGAPPTIMLSVRDTGGGLSAELAVCVLAFVGLMFVRIPALYDWFNVIPSNIPPLWRL